MSQNIGPIVENLLVRVRQQGGLAITANLATEIYSRCEQVINTALKKVVVSTTLSTPKQKLIYSLRGEFPNAVSIKSVKVGGRELPECPSFTELSALDSAWFRNITGTRFETFLQVSQDLFILYPGLTSASSVTVDYVKKIPLSTDFVADYDTASLLPDEDIELTLDLAEIILLLRMRQLLTVPERLKGLLAIFAARGVKFI